MKNIIEEEVKFEILENLLKLYKKGKFNDIRYLKLVIEALEKN